MGSPAFLPVFRVPFGLKTAFSFASALTFHYICKFFVNKNEHKQPHMVANGQKSVSLKELLPRHTLAGVDYAMYEDRLCVCRLRHSQQPQAGEPLTYPARVDFFMFVFLQQGELSLTIGLERLQLTAGMVAVCDPGNIVSSQWDTSDIDCWLLLVDPSFFEYLHFPVQRILPHMVELNRHSTRTLLPGQRGSVHRLLTLLKKTVEEDMELITYREMVFSLMNYFFQAMLGYVAYEENLKPEDARESSRDVQYFRHFMRELKGNFRTERSVGFYADRICVTPKYLSAVVRQVSGRGPMQWINECVIVEAKNLLRFSDMTVQEISRELNFPTQSYFGRFFKNHTGMSPREYKLL